MRAVSYLLASLILGSTLVSAAGPKEDYTIVKELDGFKMGLDKSHFVIHKDKLGGPPAVEVRVELSYPEDRVVNGTAVRRFRNTIVVDCAGDRLAVIASKAFNSKGEEVVVNGAGPALLDNPNNPNSTVTVVLDEVVCPAYAEALKRNKVK